MGFTALVMIGIITIIVLNLVGVVGDDQVRTLALLWTALSLQTDSERSRGVRVCQSTGAVFLTRLEFSQVNLPDEVKDVNLDIGR